MGTRIGDYELVSLVDTYGVIGSFAEVFPDVPAEAWDPYRDLYADLFDDSSWRPPFGCFLLCSEDHTVLVDAGVGPPGGSFLPDAEGLLPLALADLGIDPEGIDVCAITHLHVDHVGWASRDGRAMWPRASYVGSQRDLNWAEARAPVERDRVLRPLEPLRRAGCLSLADGAAEIAPGIRMVPTPGHTPGHSSIRIESRGSRAIILGDVAVHPALLDRPEWIYLFDVDPEATVATRKTVLEEIEGEDIIVACGHYPGGIGRVRREGSHTVWSAIE